eukprot:scpid77950/ scgid26345/ 
MDIILCFSFGSMAARERWTQASFAIRLRDAHSASTTLLLPAKGLLAFPSLCFHSHRLRKTDMTHTFRIPTASKPVIELHKQQTKLKVNGDDWKSSKVKDRSRPQQV